MKIPLIVSDLSASGSGRWGGAIRPFILAQALQKIGCQVEILGLAFESEETAAFDVPFSVLSFPCQYYSGLVAASRKLIQRVDGDIIYAVKPKTTSFGLSLIKKFLSQRPLILDIDDWELSWHGGDKWRYRPGGLKQFARDILKPEGGLRYPDHPLYLKFLEKMVIRADVVTTHTKFLQDRFGGIYIPNGKDTSLFDPKLYDPQKSRVKYGLESYRILMFPGAPRPYKGIEDILIALDILDQPDLRMVIVGGSPYDDYDQKLISRWGKWIIKLPKQPVKMMPEVVAAAHVVVVPQRDSPATKAQFPLKLTDGMAMAKPIISTKVGDIPEILGDTGCLVEPGSPEQIAAKIQWIFANAEEATTKAEEARSRCVDKYSIDTMAANLSQVLQKF